MAGSAIQEAPVVFDQIPAAWAGIELERFATLGNYDYLRMLVSGVAVLPGHPALHPDDLWRPPGPDAPGISAAIIELMAVRVFTQLTTDDQTAMEKAAIIDSLPGAIFSERLLCGRIIIIHSPQFYCLPWENII